MAEPLKTFFSAELVARLAADIVRSFPAFPARAFVEQASRGLGELELLDRGKHISRALAAHLPQDYSLAIGVLLQSLGPEHATEELVGAGMAPFFYLPHVLFVAERGLDHFDLSMHAQHALTRRFSAEASIRPYIAKYPERTLALLRAWTQDENAHVRRLVSEGTRLRLPWASRVAWLDANPNRVLELLELLKDDPTPLVRRSVANNLNDLGKVHPRLLTRTCAAWLDDATAARRALVEHALRSAVKRAEPRALALLGYGARPSVSIARVRFEPRRVVLGGHVSVRFELHNPSRKAQSLLLDLTVHFVKARGQTAAKVFKLKRIILPAGQSMELASSISFAPMTTRRHYPGLHRVELLVNGVSHPLGEFAVK